MKERPGSSHRFTRGCGRSARNLLHSAEGSASTGSAARLRGGVERVGVQDRVAVALLGQEALPVLSEVLVDGDAGDERVEFCDQAALLGAQQASEALGLLLA